MTASRRLKRVILLMLGLIGVPAIASVVTLEIQRTRYESFGALIEVASRQLAMVERVEVLAHRMLRASDPERRNALRQQLSQTAESIAEDHDALVHGSAAPEFEIKLSPETRSLYLDQPYDVDAKLHSFIRIARQLGKGSGAIRPDSPELDEIERASDPLLSGIDATVKQHENEYRAAISFVRLLAATVLVATALALVGAWFLVLRPVARRLDERRESAEEGRARLQAIVENASDLISEWDAKGRLLFVNRRIPEFTGKSTEELLGQQWLERANEVFRDAFHRATQTGRGAEATYLSVPRAGASRWLESHLQPFQTATGDLHIVNVTRDVTDLREVETLRQLTRELEATTAELSRANRELDEFASAAAHDLQEPVRKLIAFSELLEEDLGADLPEEAQRDLGFITDAARRMHRLVQDLLGLYRTGSADLKREPLAVDDCVEHALETLEIRIEETRARITRDALPKLSADPTLLALLYQNLVANALTFTEDGHPSIHLSAERSEGGWILGVRDQGIGIPPEQAERIFEPFRRLHSPGAYPGTGIGLAICRKAVERHGGRVWVESEPGRGAHFRFTLGHENDG